MRPIILAVAAAAILAPAACSKNEAPAPEAAAPAEEGVVHVSAEGDFAENLQLALIEAEPGQTIVMPEGTFEFTTGLSLDVDDVTLAGAGQGKTILDFAGQTGAGEGLLVTADDVVLTDFGIRDTKGDGIKSKDSDRITYQYLTVEWSGEPDETNGAYGIYPVESTDVLVQNCTVRGASDAGIYVGQSQNIIVRDSVAEYNVAGIEIENSSYADVYGNIARHNAGGILVFDLPDLPVMGGHSTRVYDNDIVENNTKNFAPVGNIVAGVPSGTGLIVMANSDVYVTGNRFADNRSVHVMLTAYTEPFTDENYNPLLNDITISGNTYEGGLDDPQGMLTPIAAALGGQLPAIMTDGVTRWNGGEDQAVNLVIAEAPEVGFINIGLGEYPIDPAKMQPSMDRPASTPVAEREPVLLPQDKTRP
ncbi:parallel beta-helix domain-containing protein [uncultured Hyphomonas sp.]|uniref:parallel beta-helix domain-containing protein n=1 Tax=uncultured Hyphomonas sp. TaxID=225298 RepID=UPI002AAAAA3B|nr:parallel beta-helix domain-containing protein [uncultured Hyphomonas sp.]